MTTMPISIAEGRTIFLSLGEHCRLIKGIVGDFIPHFVPGSRILYVGDARGQGAYCDQEGLGALGVVNMSTKKLPDTVLYSPAKNWLLLVEAITNHGPIDGKRRDALARLFSRSTAALLYVSAFLTMDDLARYADVIAWQTDIWIAEKPTHMIHFNGGCLYGPYDRMTT